MWGSAGCTNPKDRLICLSNTPIELLSHYGPPLAFRFLMKRPKLADDLRECTQFVA
jgi:hypothetical protein